jgi:hypothetical protein
MRKALQKRRLAFMLASPAKPWMMVALQEAYKRSAPP